MGGGETEACTAPAHCRGAARGRGQADTPIRCFIGRRASGSGGFIGPCAQGGWGDTLGPRAEERGLIVLEVRAEARSHASKKRFGDVPQSLGRSYATGRTSF